MNYLLSVGILLSLIFSPSLFLCPFFIVGCMNEFVILEGMSNAKFRAIVHRHLKRSSQLCFIRYKKDTPRFLKLLLLHSSASFPLSRAIIYKYLGHDCNVVLYMMNAGGWISFDKGNRCTVITNKGQAVVDEVLKFVEQEYSTFVCEQQEQAPEPKQVKNKNQYYGPPKPKK